MQKIQEQLERLQQEATTEQQALANKHVQAEGHLGEALTRVGLVKVSFQACNVVSKHRSKEED